MPTKQKKNTKVVPEMNTHFSVFNGHVNDADQKARNMMAIFAPDFLKELETAEKKGNGIMVIFQSKPTPATMMYVSLVAVYANKYEKLTLKESTELRVRCEAARNQ